MDKKIYVKGKRDDIIKRFSQIYQIKLRCPIINDGVKCLKTSLITSLNQYATDNGGFKEIPVVDLYNLFLYTLNFCKDNNINVDKLYIIMGCIQSFKALKYISIDFVDDKELDVCYDKIKNNINDENEKIKVLKKIYDVEILEMNLSNMFSQEVIDLFNKCMMSNGLLQNSYLKREFYISFDYDGYVAFMDMFLGNNGIMFEEMDSDIVDYFRLFPVFIANQKPNINVITNYRDI